MLRVLDEAGGTARPAAGAGTTAPGPQVGGDVRATAALAVLAGIAPDTVADRCGVTRAVLDGWVRAFVDAGTAGVGGRAGAAAGDAGAGAAGAGAGSVEGAALRADRHMGVVAHELRSPLAMIRGWSELLRDAADEPEVRAQAISGILAQVDRLGRLADDAVDAAAIALGRVSLVPVRTSLAEAVRQVLRARSAAAPALQVVEDAEVAVDPDRFAQVVDNLVENGRKHGGGVVGIRVDRDGPWAEVEVASAGAAIPAALSERLFEPFERGAGAAAGSGLGLYVCRSLAAAHGGQVGLRAGDAGNAFWLRLPVAPGLRHDPA